MDSLIALAYDPSAWAALMTLIAMEVVLGIDNLVFVAVLSNRLPEEMRAKARMIGLVMALAMRVGLLGFAAWIVSLTAPVFAVADHSFSWRDMILIGGGLFLVWKATKEIHHSVRPAGAPAEEGAPGVAGTVSTSFFAAIGQILLLDLVFSVDSIITAVGMTEHLPIMVVAVLVAVGVMIVAAGPLANFIAANPSVVMLALGFLIMIGMTLIAEGFGAHVEKGYVYAAMGFSAAVEALNMFSRRATRKNAPAE